MTKKIIIGAGIVAVIIIAYVLYKKKKAATAAKAAPSPDPGLSGSIDQVTAAINAMPQTTLLIPSKASTLTNQMFLISSAS